MNKKLSIALMATFIAFSATACGGNDPAPKEPLVKSAAGPEKERSEAGLIRFVAQGTVAGNEKTFTEDNFLKVDPDAKFAITAYGTAESLPLDGEREIHAASGEVFHLVTYAYDYNVGSAVTFSVIVNNGDPKLVPSEMPTSGVMLISAEEDAEITIQAATGGLPSDGGSQTATSAGVQTIDVKTAERTSTNLEVWYKNGTASVQDANLLGKGGTSPYTLSVRANVEGVYRSAYVEGRGWVKEGHAFIYAKVSEPSFNLEKHGTAQQDSFKVIAKDPQGKTYVGEPDGDDAYVFTVPLDVDTFTIYAEASSTITLSGNTVASVQGLVTSGATAKF